jgi:hypothetical protein
MVAISVGLMPPIVIGKKICFKKKEIEIKEVSVNI